MKRFLRLVLGNAVLLSALLLVSCASLSQIGRKPVVVFDQGHGQKFLVENTGHLDLSNFSELLTKKGLKVKVSRAMILDETLADASALVVSGPFLHFSAEEIKTISEFIKRGGRLCVMLHIGSPAAELLHALDVDFSNGVIREREGIMENDPINFHVTRLKNHALTAGLKQFNLYGGWALVNTSDRVEIIAETGPKAWVDLDGDKKLSPQDAVQSFGVLAVGSLEKGKFAVFGDDAIFQNRFLDEVNTPLAANLAEWLAGGR